MKPFWKNFNTRDALLFQLSDHNRSLLDSGNYYGRNSDGDQNALLDKPVCELKFSFDEAGLLDSIDATVNMEAFLLDRLAFSPEFQALFEKSGREGDNFVDLLKEKGWGLYASPLWGNTYNSDFLLNRDFEYFAFDAKKDGKDSSIAIIKTHNGCDIRAGYSDPFIYLVNDCEVAYLFPTSEITANLSLLRNELINANDDSYEEETVCAGRLGSLILRVNEIIETYISTTTDANAKEKAESAVRANVYMTC